MSTLVFNDHSRLEGMHAFLSPSQNAWLNYDEEKLEERLITRFAAAHGTRLHEFAKEAILLKQRLPRTNQTLNRYVNDAIGFKMTPEQTLFYSINCFGTADAIRLRNGLLRIHDLKTGNTKTTFTQLEVYAALTCLEYDIRPGELEIKLRIYQHDELYEHSPELDRIAHIMDRIISLDKHIERKKQEDSL